MLRRQVELLEQLVNGKTEIDKPSEIKSTPKGIIVSCIQYLRDHPSELYKSSRELEKVVIDGRTVSYRTWADAKKYLSSL